MTAFLDSLSLNYVGLIIAGGFLFFIVLGIVRGFTNDILSLLTWIGAVYATKEAMPHTQAWGRSVITEPFFADLLTGVIIFLLALFILVFLTKIISGRIRRSILSSLDRALGIVSGSVRALTILVAVYLMSLLCFKAGQTPKEFTNSKLIMFVHVPAQWTHHYLIPQDLFPSRLLKHLYGENAVYKPNTDIQALVKDLSSPQPGPQRGSTAKPVSTPQDKTPTSEQQQRQDDQVSLTTLIDKLGSMDD